MFSIATTTPTPSDRLRSLPRPLAALLALVLAVAVVGCSSGGDAPAASGIEEPTFEFFIPEGAGETLARGETVDILPREMNTKVGETIAIHNNDTIAHAVGPWFVGPGEVLRQRFLTVGVYEGACSVHESGQFTVIVEEA